MRFIIFRFVTKTDILFCFAVLSMPDTVEEMCPEMPRLERLLKDVNDVSESGARYSDMPQVWIYWLDILMFENSCISNHFHLVFKKNLSLGKLPNLMEMQY